MKKVKLLISIIYIIFFIIISSISIYFAVVTSNKSGEILFKEDKPQTTELIIQESQIDNILNFLKKYKFIE